MLSWTTTQAPPTARQADNGQGGCRKCISRATVWGFGSGIAFSTAPPTHTHTGQNQLYIVYGIWYGAQRHPEISATEQRKAAQQRRRDGIFGVRCKQQ